MALRLLLLGLLLPLGALAGRPPLNYLYVVAAEGNASGGHVAVQFGDAVYHFQHVDGGLVRLQRDGVRDFEYRYRLLENRDLEVLGLAVDAGAFARLRERFETRYQIQRLQFGLAGLLAQEERWLTAIGAGRPVTLELAGAGLFYTAPVGDAPGRPEPVLARLAARLGTARLDARIRRLDTALARLAPAVWQPAGFAAGDPVHVPAAPYAFSERYQDLLTRRLVLQALRQARPLRPGVLRTPAAAAFRLGSQARAALCRFRGTLTRRIARLVETPHADTGTALFVLMGRLIAVSRSCDSGRLAFLDRFAADAEAVPPGRVSDEPGFWVSLRRQAAAQLAAALKAFRQAAGQGDYPALEAAANRYHELERCLRTGAPIRLFGVEPLPARPLRVRRSVTPAASRAAVAAALARVRRARRDWQASLRRWYRYDLLRRNCVTEALRLLGIRARFARGEFVPFLSTRAVARRYRIRERRRLLSHRHGLLRQRYRRSPGWQVYLRESNTLTATLYRPNEEDSFFVFFTDDVVLPRPFYGSVNTAVGLVLTGAGVAAAPFDGGQLLRRSVRGLFSSLVELGFGNVRKGSYRYLPPAPSQLSP